MNHKTIFDVKDKCLGDILAYLDMKDHANVSQVCQRFRQGFVTWSAKQYKDFRTEGKNMKMFFIASENVENLRVDLREILYFLKPHSCAHRHIMFLNFCEQFQNMKALRSLELYLNADICKILSHFNICDEMVKFLKDLPHLTELEIESDFKDYNLNAFCELKLLTRLVATRSVHIDLKELCKSNEKLNFLKVDGEYGGNILDIVPFCCNLKTFVFWSNQNIDNYAALGELPQLQCLNMKNSIHNENLKLMCQSFASKNILQRLILFNDKYETRNFVDLEKTKLICKIKSLIKLRCNFIDYECVKYLAQLTNLRNLTFVICSNSVDFSDSLRHILRECKQMESMHISADGLPQSIVFQAFIVLEVVRNPQKQKPLKLRLQCWKYDLASEDKELFKSYIKPFLE